MINLVILGSTGSIGSQALALADMYPELIKIRGLAADTGGRLFMEQIAKYKPDYAALANKEAAEKYSSEEFRLLSGPEGICELASLDCADMVLVAVVGIAGLDAVMAALKAGKRVALANKEALVAGGECVMRLAGRAGEKLLPVDSEHSAIFQCLQDEYSAKSLQKILLTASGGPFFGRTRQELQNVTKDDALRHPNWSMGSKITIDSATLMNKGLELIEAVWLFGLPAEQVQVVVQRQSIIHSMVQFSDNSILAQLGVPDMRIPIQYALTWPERVPGPAPELDFTKLHELTFDTADEATFRCLAACKKAIGKGGLAPCAANGANEEAVRLFLEGRIPFLKIGELVEGVVDSEAFGGPYTLDDVYACDAAARAYVLAHVS